MARAGAWLRVFFRVRDDPIGGTMNVKPQRKVVAATAGAAIGELLAYGAVSGLGLIDFPTASLTIVCAFVLGWLIPEG